MAADEAGNRPIGLLILGRKRPGFDQEWSQLICRRGVAALQALGYVVIGADEHAPDDAAVKAALGKIVAARCEALVILQPSIGNGQLALTVAQRWQASLILWATPERPGGGKVSSCSLVGQHLWASTLRQAGHPFEFVYGDPDDARVRAELSRAIALARTTAALNMAKVGIVGTHAPGFIDMAADPFLLRKSIGIQLHSLSLPQFIERAQSVPDETAHADVQRVRDLKLPSNGIGEEALAVNSRCYIALSALMEEESLDALALQCWPELPNVLGQWPYLAVSRLSTEGRIIAIEGDTDGCIGSLMSSMLGFGPGFLADWLEHDESSIYFWHPGMAPIDMCEPVGSENGPALGMHFNVAKPMVVTGQIRLNEPVTISRLWQCDHRYHMTAFEGRTVAPRRRVGGNEALVEVTEPDVPARFDRLLHAGMPHHVLISFGNHAETFRRLARMLGIEWCP